MIGGFDIQQDCGLCVGVMHVDARARTVRTPCVRLFKGELGDFVLWSSCALISASVLRDPPICTGAS